MHERTAIYVPLVNRLTGAVLTQERADAIALAVLKFNRDHPQRPVYVLADDSDIGSNHSPDVAAITRPIGTATGADLGDQTLGHMSDWTVTIATPGTVFGVPHAHITFAVTGNQHLRAALTPATNSRAYTSTSTTDELISAAALCLTSRDWMEESNQRTLQNLCTLRLAIAHINNTLGFDAYTISSPTAGGRHTAIRLHPRLFPVPSNLTVESLTKSRTTTPEHGTPSPTSPLDKLLTWHHHDPERNTDPRLTLRTNLAVPPATIGDTIKKLEHVATTLARPELVITAKQQHSQP